MTMLMVETTEGGVLPQWDAYGNAGLDLHINMDITLLPRERKTVPLGIKTAFSSEYVAVLKDRSGLAAKHGLTVLGGVIDSCYRGEWHAVLLNTGAEPIILMRGDRVCQAIIVRAMHLQIHHVQVLPDSTRGSKGFGSSGQ